MRFQAIWQAKWTQSIDVSGLDIALEEWGLAIADLPDASIKAALDYLRVNGEDWPPSIPQFIRIADRQSGMPSPREMLDLLIRRDFSNPMAKLIYERIGSWDLSRATEKELLSRVEGIMKENRVSPIKMLDNKIPTALSTEIVDN